MNGHAAEMPTLVFARTIRSIQSQSSASELCHTKVSFMKGIKINEELKENLELMKEEPLAD